jgi:hypothetical protein
VSLGVAREVACWACVGPQATAISIREKISLFMTL